MTHHNSESDKNPARIIVAFDLAEADALIAAALEMSTAIVENHARLCGTDYEIACSVRARLVSCVHTIVDGLHDAQDAQEPELEPLAARLMGLHTACISGVILAAQRY
jgi:hypothetical protein